MKMKILMVSIGAILLGGCASGNVSLGVTDAHGARTQCASQSAHEQMSPEQRREFMRRCMAGYGYGSADDQGGDKPFTVPMPKDDRKTH